MLGLICFLITYVKYLLPGLCELSASLCTSSALEALWMIDLVRALNLSVFSTDLGCCVTYSWPRLITELKVSEVLRHSTGVCTQFSTSAECAESLNVWLFYTDAFY